MLDFQPIQTSGSVAVAIEYGQWVRLTEVTALKDVDPHHVIGTLVEQYISDSGGRPPRNILRAEYKPTPTITVRVFKENGEIIGRTLFHHGGWGREYRTDSGLERAIERCKQEDVADQASAS